MADRRRRRSGDDLRLVQLTPPGSGCSVAFGTGLSSAPPAGPLTLELVVSDIDAARDAVLAAGVDRVEVFHGAPWDRIPARTPSAAATARTARSTTPRATNGCCRRSPNDPEAPPPRRERQTPALRASRAAVTPARSSVAVAPSPGCAAPARARSSPRSGRACAWGRARRSRGRGRGWRPCRPGRCRRTVPAAGGDLSAQRALAGAIVADRVVLGHGRDEASDPGAEAPAHVADRAVGVLDDVVEEPRNLHRLGAAGVAQHAGDGAGVGRALARLDPHVAVRAVQLRFGARERVVGQGPVRHRADAIGSASASPATETSAVVQRQRFERCPSVESRRTEPSASSGPDPAPVPRLALRP